MQAMHAARTPRAKTAQVGAARPPRPPRTSKAARAAQAMKAGLAVMLALLLGAFPLGACSAGSSAAAGGAAVPVRDAVNDYSWDELSAVSADIAAAADEDAALAIAKRYHLVNDDGALDGTQSKEIELATGEKTAVTVAGIRHDDVPGGGKAGLTFAFADAVALREMNNNAGFDGLSETTHYDTVGGWNASGMRGWLNDEFAQWLPADLQAVLADTVKTSLVVPESETEVDDAGALLTSVDALVGQGVDKLWLPALVELSGVKDNSPTADAYPAWTAPLKAEGSQYRLFRDAKVSERNPNDILVRSLAGSDASPCRWWLRSVEDWTYAEIAEDGAIDRRDEVPTAGTPQGVVPFFAV